MQLLSTLTLLPPSIVSIDRSQLCWAPRVQEYEQYQGACPGLRLPTDLDLRVSREQEKGMSAKYWTCATLETHGPVHPACGVAAKHGCRQDRSDCRARARWTPSATAQSLRCAGVHPPARTPVRTCCCWSGGQGSWRGTPKLIITTVYRYMHLLRMPPMAMRVVAQWVSGRPPADSCLGPTVRGHRAALARV